MCDANQCERGKKLVFWLHFSCSLRRFLKHDQPTSRPADQNEPNATLKHRPRFIVAPFPFCGIAVEIYYANCKIEDSFECAHQLSQVRNCSARVSVFTCTPSFCIHYAWHEKFIDMSGNTGYGRWMVENPHPHPHPHTLHFCVQNAFRNVHFARIFQQQQRMMGSVMLDTQIAFHHILFISPTLCVCAWRKNVENELVYGVRVYVYSVRTRCNPCHFELVDLSLFK